MAGVRMLWSAVAGAHLAPLTERLFLWTERTVRDDDLLRRAVTRFVCPSWHPAGTAAMGPAGRPEAVVDERLRVHGLGGLRVVDASVMPVVPAAPVNLSAIMLGERAASWSR
ncbi:GMC family oxidoreductase [Streptomyces zhihengii]